MHIYIYIYVYIYIPEVYVYDTGQPTRPHAPSSWVAAPKASDCTRAWTPRQMRRKRRAADPFCPVHVRIESLPKGSFKESYKVPLRGLWVWDF